MKLARIGIAYFSGRIKRFIQPQACQAQHAQIKCLAGIYNGNVQALKNLLPMSARIDISLHGKYSVRSTKMDFAQKIVDFPADRSILLISSWM